MTHTIKTEPLTQSAFELFGDVIETGPDRRHYPINGGTTERYHDLATVVARGEDPRAIISIGRAQPFTLPLELKMMERHPYGSQAFIPLKPAEFVVIAAPDDHGRPGTPRAFLAAPGQGINFFLGTWHGVLSVLGAETDFLIVDREGEEGNLQEYFFDEPYRIER